jgi:copper resistance protein B
MNVKAYTNPAKPMFPSQIAAGFRTMISTSISAALVLALLSASAGAHEGDDPLLTQLLLEQLEARSGPELNTQVLKAEAWAGWDLHKFKVKVDVDAGQDSAAETELQGLYSRALAPFWDLQLGVRRDHKPNSAHTWGVLGLQGMAPYFIEVDAALFVDESGHGAARFSGAYDALLTQRLILSPSLELNFYTDNDPEAGTGSGLADAQAGLRLRFEIAREFAPYVGVHWRQQYGKTAIWAQGQNATSSAPEWVFGLRAWF